MSHKDSRIQGVRGSSEMFKNYVTVHRFNGNSDITIWGLSYIETDKLEIL